MSTPDTSNCDNGDYRTNPDADMVWKTYWMSVVACNVIVLFIFGWLRFKVQND